MLAVLHSTRDAFLKVFQPDADAVQLRLFKQFARSLDASQPGIAKLARAAAAGDTAATADRLFAYASSRALMPKLRLTAWGTEEQHLARAAMAREDTFRLQGVSFRVPRRADGGLDWAHSGPNSDPEWSWFLNRLAHLHSAQVAWNKTGEECYRSLIEEQLVDWIRSHPRPQGVSFSASWRPLEAARRTTGCWLSICFPSDGVPILGAHATLLAWSSAIDHSLVLRNHHSTGGNHLLSEMSALAAIALAWPEFTASGEWLEYAIATFNSQLVSQTYPDGSHTEMSNHYHRVATLEAQQFLNTLSNCGHHALHDELRPRVARMWDYLAGVMRPDGYGPLNNDGGLDHNASSLRNFGLDEAAPERRYIATYGRSGTEPAGPSSRYYPWAGQAITRSGWRHDAQWARFDMGPHGTDHQHADQLSIELMAGGRALLVDSGRYTYKPGPLRDYFIGAQAHNVVLLDGVGSIPPSDRIRAPMPALAHIGPRIQCFASQAKFPSSPGHGTGASTWTRALFYVEGQYWVVLDLLLAFGAREATVNWHFGPTCEGSDARPRGRHNRFSAKQSGAQAQRGFRRPASARQRTVRPGAQRLVQPEL